MKLPALLLLPCLQQALPLPPPLPLSMPVLLLLQLSPSLQLPQHVAAGQPAHC
jgi:hypothetical protein